MKQRDKQTDVFYTLLILILVVLAMWMLSGCSKEELPNPCECTIQYRRKITMFNKPTVPQIDYDRPVYTDECLDETGGWLEYKNYTGMNYYTSFQKKIECQ